MGIFKSRRSLSIKRSWERKKSETENAERSTDAGIGSSDGIIVYNCMGSCWPFDNAALSPVARSVRCEGQGYVASDLCVFSLSLLRMPLYEIMTLSVN